MATNYTPKPYTGTKYEGSSAGFDVWERDIVGILGPLGLRAVLTKSDFFGTNSEGRVREDKLAPEDIEDGLDMQSKISMWLQTTLTGAALTKYQMLEKGLHPCEDNARTIPKAFDVFNAIKNNINPDECIEIESQLMRDLINRPFPGKSGREAVLEWFDQQQKTRNEIMVRSAEGGGYKDEKLFVVQMLELISHSITNEMYQMLNKESQVIVDGKKQYCIQGLDDGLHMIYPIGSSRAMGGRGAINFHQNKCIHCEKEGHAPDDCWRHPNAYCEICKKKGHTAKICPDKRKGGKGGKGDKNHKEGKGGKGDKNANRKLKKEKEKMMIAFAKEKGYDPSAPQLASVCLQPPAAPQTLQVVTHEGRQYVLQGGQMNLIELQPPQQAPRVPPVARRGQILLMKDSTSSKLINLMNEPHEPKAPSRDLVMLQDDQLVIEPDRDLEREQAKEADYESLDQALHGIKPGGTIMLCQADSPPSKDWIKVKALIDGGASVTGTSVRGTVHSHTAELAGPTGGIGGSAYPVATGNVTLMIGGDQYFNLLGTSEYELLAGHDLIISEDQLEEMGIDPQRRNNRVILPDGTIVPTIRGGRLWWLECYIYAGQGSPPPCINASGPLKTLNDVHEAMGCTGEDNLRKTFDLVDGLPQVKGDEFVPCKNCHAAKDKRQPIEREPDVPEREYRLGEAVGMDTSARQPMSIQGALYWQLIVEFFSKYITAQLLVGKSDAAEAFREYCVKNWPPDIVQIDGGGEYEAAFEDFCDALHIHHRRSAPDTQAQNFIAEIGMKLIATGARADLIRSGLPLKFWADAIMNFVDTYNCRFNAGVSSGKTPYEAFHGRRPDLSMKRKFGTPCNVLVHHPDNKFAPRSIQGIYVRMAMGYKAWRIYIPDQDCYVISRHVTFDALPKNALQFKEEVDKWWLKLIEGEKEGEVYDADRSEGLPPVIERADLSCMPTDKGKEGAHKAAMLYRTR